MKNILVVIPVEKYQKTQLEESYPEGNFVYSTIGTVTLGQVKAANYIIGNAPADMVAQSEKLEWMQLNSAGADAYIKPGVIRKDAILTNATGAYGLAVAEHLFAMTYMLMKKLNLYYENQRNKVWKDMGQVTSFYQSRTLVIGLGDIGCEYARRAKAMGSYVVGLKRRKSEKPDCVDELYTMEVLAEQLEKADVVAMFLPGTKETYHIMDVHMLACMKKTAFLVNGGRGTAIDHEALKEVLDCDKLAGAAMDVTDPEPLPAEHPLWNAKNILITPHISGDYHLTETKERIIKITVENLNAMRYGENLKNVVDFTTGYKM